MLAEEGGKGPQLITEGEKNRTGRASRTPAQTVTSKVTALKKQAKIRARGVSSLETGSQSASSSISIDFSFHRKIVGTLVMPSSQSTTTLYNNEQKKLNAILFTCYSLLELFTEVMATSLWIIYLEKCRFHAQTIMQLLMP